MQNAARHVQDPIAIDRSIRVRLATERTDLAEHLTRLLGDERHIELLPGTNGVADVLLLDCADFASESTASLQQTGHRHLPARPLWVLDSAPAGRHATRRVLEAVKEGWCDGFVVRNCPADILLRAIGAVARREIFLPRSMLTRALFESDRRRSSGLPLPRANRSRVLLTVRERQIVQQVLRGLTSKEAGRNLGIKEDTVKKHLRNVYAKLGVRGRSQLFLKASGRDLPVK